MEPLISLGGVAAMITIAWAFSEDRSGIPWRLVAACLVLQFAIAGIILATRAGNWLFDGVQAAFHVVSEASLAGSSFVFGQLTEIIEFNPDAVVAGPTQINAVLAFRVLTLIVFVSCLAGILYHLGIIQALVRGMAWLMQRSLKTSGAETFGAALMVFMGIEAMPALKAYLRTMTRAELCTVMTAFMATIATDVMFIYASFGAQPGHLLAASLMSAPAAILIARILVPETGIAPTRGAARIDVPIESHNVVDGAARGASEGLSLALNVGALLIAFVSLIYLVNMAFSAAIGISFTDIMGYAFTPFAFLMGVPLAESPAVGQLLGTKTVINEFIAYSNMKDMIDAGTLSPRSVTIATYALCGFANPGSLGILIACLTGLVPERRKDITELGLKSLVSGTLAVFMTACIAGVMIR